MIEPPLFDRGHDSRDLFPTDFRPKENRFVGTRHAPPTERRGGQHYGSRSCPANPARKSRTHPRPSLSHGGASNERGRQLTQPSS
jgi:hypothetical protein